MLCATWSDASNPLRKSMMPKTVGKVMVLKINHKIWNTKSFIKKLAAAYEKTPENEYAGPDGFNERAWEEPDEDGFGLLNDLDDDLGLLSDLEGGEDM